MLNMSGKAATKSSIGSFGLVVWCLLLVSCLMSDRVTAMPLRLEGRGRKKAIEIAFSEVDMRREAWDVSGDGRRQDVGQVMLDDETVTFLLWKKVIEKMEKCSFFGGGMTVCIIGKSEYIRECQMITRIMQWMTCTTYRRLSPLRVKRE